MRKLRYELRWAWAKLGCRCLFSKHHTIQHVDAHCPVHGWYEAADPEGWENVKP